MMGWDCDGDVAINGSCILYYPVSEPGYILRELVGSCKSSEVSCLFYSIKSGFGLSTAVTVYVDCVLAID